MSCPSQAGLVLVLTLLPVSSSFAAGSSQKLIVKQDLQVPGAVLHPGTYTLSLEDTLTDRAIVRVSSSADANPTLLLAVPNAQLSVNSDSRLAYFTAAGGKALRAWKCPSCSAALEFAYPKLEAAKLADETAGSVMAVDPAYDKLPDNLSADDRKVVTLWLLSPERIVGRLGVGVKAAKYVSPGLNRELASNGSKTATDSGVSNQTSTSGMPRQLPQTASNTYGFLLIGLTALSLGSLLHLKRFRRL